MQKCKALDARAVELKQQMAKCRDQHNELLGELHNMRKIITVMVNTGADPVEAKLKTDMRDESLTTLWDAQVYGYDIEYETDHGIDGPIDEITPSQKIIVKLISIYLLHNGSKYKITA